jgi:translation elongation factor EF-Tu-like GTPase
MAGTTAFNMKKALIREAKEDLPVLAADDAIWDSAYSGVARPRQLLWFGEIVWSEDIPVTFGRTLTQREETYSIRFGVEINDFDDTQTACNNKAEAILAVVEDMARVRQRFADVAGIVSCGVVPVGLGEGPGGAEGQRAAIIAAQVNVKARK